LGPTRGPTRRLTLREAADLLGISKEAVRKRAIRGSLRTDKDADGRVYVYLDVPVDAEGDAGTVRRNGGAADFTDPRDRLIAHLSSEVEAWREEAIRKDHIIAGLIERLPPQLESPESGDSPGRSEAGRSQETPISAEESPQKPKLKRPWWRQMFGGS
jgi:hypothetical protein